MLNILSFEIQYMICSVDLASQLTFPAEQIFHRTVHWVPLIPGEGGGMNGEWAQLYFNNIVLLMLKGRASQQQLTLRGLTGAIYFITFCQPDEY
jgi:hypothetical protein